MISFYFYFICKPQWWSSGRVFASHDVGGRVQIPVATDLIAIKTGCVSSTAKCLPTAVNVVYLSD